MRPLARASLLVLLAAALAPAARAAPAGLAWSAVLDTAIPDLAISDDGRWVVLVAEGSDTLRLLDMGSWEVVGDTAACTGSSLGGVAISGADGDYSVFAGCSDGTVIGFGLDNVGTTTYLWDQAVALSGAGAVLAVESDGASVYAITEASKGNDQVHLVDAATGTESTDGFPSTFGQAGFADSWLGTNYLFVSHGGQDVSKVDLLTGAIATSTENLAGRELGDLFAFSDAAAFLADGSGAVIRYNPGGNDFDILLDDEDGLGSVQALAIDDEEGWLALYDGGSGEVVLFDFSGLACGDVERGRYAVADVAEMVVANGYVVAGGGGGALQVLTDRPWVEIETISPASAVLGDEVAVSFSADADGDWELLRGGSVAGDGDVLASGTLEAGVATQASFAVDASFEEGENPLWVLVGSGEHRGHDRTALSVDNPPSKVQLGPDSLGFGNQVLSLSFEGIDDADLDHYDVYCTVTPFEAADWPSGGPEFDGEDETEQEFPVSVSASGGEAVSLTIQPLTNGVTYYIAVRAYDQGGKEGEMSDVVSGTPCETIGAAALAGEAGGYCGTRGRAALASTALGLGLLALRRRRLPAAVLLGLLAAPAALAGEEGPRPREYANVELRFGPYFPDSDAVRTVYGEGGHAVLQLEGGAKLGRFLELDLGTGFYQELSTLVSVDTREHSAEHAMLTAWPLGAALGLRLDVLKEQFLVPTAEIGLDYWLWRENWYRSESVGGETEISGGELGWHWGAGVNLLLDRLDPKHASSLAVATGIDDTYLVVDWRSQRLGQWMGDGASLFDGSMVTIGIKLDM